MIDRVQQREQLAGLVAVAEHREGDHRPDGAVRVLAAILANAGRIALDVSGIERRLVERRREEQHQTVVAPDEVFFDRRHGVRGVGGIGGLGDHAP